MSEKGFARVLDEVGREVIQECEEIINRGLRDAERMVEDRKASIMEKVSTIINSAARAKETIRSRSLSLAEVKARGIALQALEDYVSEVIQEALKTLRERSMKGELREELKKLIIESINAVGEKEVKIYTAKHLLNQVKEIVREVEQETETNITVEDEPVETVFGVVAKSVDESVSFDSRVETIAARIRSRIRQEIITLLGSPL